MSAAMKYTTRHRRRLVAWSAAICCSLTAQLLLPSEPSAVAQAIAEVDQGSITAPLVAIDRLAHAVAVFADLVGGVM